MRACAALEEYKDEDMPGGHPAVLMCAEKYGSLKLELRPDLEGLKQLCEGSRIEWSKHLEIEKQIKGWLLNGSHWLIALSAFQESEGNRDLKLNEFLTRNPENQRFAAEVLKEMRDGIEILLLQDPQYAEFVKDIPPGDYLDGSIKMILERFSKTEDSISRILARFRAPSPR